MAAGRKDTQLEVCQRVILIFIEYSHSSLFCWLSLWVLWGDVDCFFYEGGGMQRNNDENDPA